MEIAAEKAVVIASSGRIDMREALQWAAENRALLEKKWAELSGDE